MAVRDSRARPICMRGDRSTIAAMVAEWAALWLLALIVALLAIAWASRLRRSRIAKGRARRAVAGEKRAALLLEAAGYEVLEAQVPARYPLVVDGVARDFDVRADYVVSKDGRRWVAEVKTGALAPKLELAATRRQLLEYGVAFEADGVLLVDAESDHIAVVELPWRRTSQASRATPWLVILFIACVVLGSVLALIR